MGMVNTWLQSSFEGIVMKRLVIVCVLFLVPFGAMATDRFPVAETLESYIKNGELPGVVTVIATKDSVLQIDTIGDADIETRATNEVRHGVLDCIPNETCYGSCCDDAR